jgi:hypothetical protein
LGNALRTLDLDRSPHLLEGSLDLLGLVPPHALLDDLWRALDKIFRFLQPESREESDFLMTSILISPMAWRTTVNSPFSVG